MAEIDSISLPTNAKDLAGKRFGRLIAISYAGKNKSGKTQWRCRCDCGNYHMAASSDLCQGDTKSCGCRNVEAFSARFTSHGMSNTPTHKSWMAMIDRCHTKSSSAYRRYGGRGIFVCQRWRESFESFLEDMGIKPSSDHSIDRIDNEKEYCKSNCRWATRIEQARNKRNNHLLTYNGKTMCLTEWGEVTGIKQHVLRKRLKRGWSVERTLTQPCGKNPLVG